MTTVLIAFGNFTKKNYFLYLSLTVQIFSGSHFCVVRNVYLKKQKQELGTKSRTSVFEQPICANGHGPCTASQSPITGS